jgi:hypothetical protein
MRAVASARSDRSLTSIFPIKLMLSIFSAITHLVQNYFVQLVGTQPGTMGSHLRSQEKMIKTFFLAARK